MDLHKFTGNIKWFQDFFLEYNGQFKGELMYDDPPRVALRADLLLTARFLC